MSSEDPLAIRSFGDAVAEAIVIQEHFGYGHAAAILDDDGVVLDLAAFTAKRHSIDDALDWANCMVLNEPRTTRMVLLSAVRKRVRELREADLDILRRARAVFGEQGVEIVDWIQTDGKDIRSLALTAGVGAWSTGG
jgi:hypothetical protein